MWLTSFILAAETCTVFAVRTYLSFVAHVKVVAKLVDDAGFLTVQDCGR